MRLPITLLAGTILAGPLYAQDQASPPQPDAPAVEGEAIDDDDVIVVNAERPRGSVLGEIEPEHVLDPRDIAATGASSIEELLDALAPEIGSSRGRGSGRPVLLVDGQRISGFRELRDLPPEAIERMDILPEETALLYGYKADQRVVNIVLRERFNSTGVRLEATAPTGGGRIGGEIDLNRIILRNGKRTTVSLDVEGDSALTENERRVALQPIETPTGPLDPRPYRTLLPDRQQLRLNAVHRRSVGQLGATINIELEQTDNGALLGPSLGELEVPVDSPFAAVPGTAETLLVDGGLGALGRDTRARSASLAGALTGAPGEWNWSATATGTLSETRTRTDIGPDVSGLQARLDALDPDADPRAIFDFAALGAEVANTRTRSLAADGVVNGSLGQTAAGSIGLTLSANASLMDIDSDGFRGGTPLATDLARRRLAAAFNSDLPLLDDFSPIGSFGVNANGELENVSDFGTLTTIGAGFNWKPSRTLNLIGSWTLEEGAPTLSQLGDPRITSPAARFFDFVTGETVLVTALSGGNPDLRADRRNVLKLSGNWKLPTSSDLTLFAEFVRQRTDDPAASFPAASAAIEAAFPDRFLRDETGQLVLVDLSPVNYADERSDTLRWGLSWSKQLESSGPSEAQRARFRARRQAARAEARQEQPEQQEQPESGNAPEQKQSEQAAPEAPPRQARPRGGGRRGFGPGGRGGRLYATLFHTITLADDVLIAPGLPRLDYLGGEARSGTGGRPRHLVEARTGIFKDGFGLRLSANWRSATRVDSGDGSLHFDDHATLDLRTFVNLNERFDVMAKAPWLRGTSLRLSVDNILNARPDVRDEAGNVPTRYQPDLIEPLGRTISLSIRKLFVPRRFGRGGGDGN